MKAKKILLYAVLIIIFSACNFPKNTNKSNPKAKANTFLWEVRPKNDTNKIMYLLGSIHIGVKEMYPLNPVIMKAFDKSDVLGVEFNIEDFDISDFGPDLQSKLISFTEKLDSKLPAEIYKRLKSRLLENGIPEFTIDFFTPLGAALILELGNIMEAIKNFDGESDNNVAVGIDKYFLRLAAEEGKKIIEVESLNRQIQVLEEMNEFIVDYISALLDKTDDDSSEEEIKNLFTAWIDGDIKTLEQIINTPYSANPKIDAKLKDALLYKRNDEMTAKIEKYFLDDRTYFIVIGAGHFVGNRSIIDNLTKTKKYIIKRF